MRAIEFITAAMFNAVLALGRRFGHEWVSVLSPHSSWAPFKEIIQSQIDADRVYISTIEAAHTFWYEEALEAGCVVGGISFRSYVRDNEYPMVLSHTTGTGRTEWNVYSDGTVHFLIRRPNWQRLDDGSLMRADGTTVVVSGWVHADNYSVDILNEEETYWRHVNAAYEVVAAICPTTWEKFNEYLKEKGVSYKDEPNRRVENRARMSAEEEEKELRTLAAECEAAGYIDLRDDYLRRADGYRNNS